MMIKFWFMRQRDDKKWSENITENQCFSW